MSDPSSKRPKQLTNLAVLWVIFGLWNLWVAFQGISGDLGVWDLLSNPFLHEWARMAIPIELGINITVFVAAIVQILTVLMVLTRNRHSVKFALGVFACIAILNLVSGSLYASAPPELQSPELTSAVLQGFGLGIFQVIIAAFFWRDLNKPEVKTYFKPSTAQQKVVQEEMVANKEDTKVVAEPKFYCRYCGAENKSDAIFCDSCGKKLK